MPAALPRSRHLILGALSVFLGAWLGAASAFGATQEYSLTIASDGLNLTGQPAEGMTINGSIPGPTLRFTEGDTARIHVTNRMDVPTSIHWHGVLVPPDMDGVPFITFPPIAPGATFTYEFPIRQAGTYWYHSHSELQEQSGVYGSIVILPAGGDSRYPALRDEVVLFSDWTDEDPASVLHTLRSGSEFYSLRKRSAQSLFGAIRAGHLRDYLTRELQRMPAMDISDVAYDRFLANGRPEQNLVASPGEQIRLRLIDGSATTFFHVQFAGGPMTIIAADGQDVEPVAVDRLLIGVAETYDVLITVPATGRYELRATSHDRSGRTSVWIGSGTPYAAPDVPAPDLYQGMGTPSWRQIFALTPGGSMGMPDDQVDAGAFDQPGMNMGGMDMEGMDMNMPGMDMGSMDMGSMSMGQMSGGNMDGMNMGSMSGGDMDAMNMDQMDGMAMGGMAMPGMTTADGSMAMDSMASPDSDGMDAGMAEMDMSGMEMGAMDMSGMDMDQMSGMDMSGMDMGAMDMGQMSDGDMGGMEMGQMSGMDEGGMSMPGMDMGAMSSQPMETTSTTAMPGSPTMPLMVAPPPLSDWMAGDVSAQENVSTDGSAERPWSPYGQLRATRSTALDPTKPVREIRLTLDGDMERYVWFLNDQPLSAADSIRIREGEVVRFILINRTMMHHPMHLHGHFFRVINGQGDFAPLKHTVDVEPMSTTVIEFDANEKGDWFFHCHLLYHMHTGMARVVEYEDFDPDPATAAVRDRLFEDHFDLFGTASLLSNMTEGHLDLANSRNTFRFDWEAGWQEVPDLEWEGTATYERYWNRFTTFFAGVDTLGEKQEFEDTRAVGGLAYLLPFNLASRSWLDSDGGARVEVMREFTLTPRFALETEATYDTHTRWEGSVALDFHVTRQLAGQVRWHSDFGWGAGLGALF